MHQKDEIITHLQYGEYLKFVSSQEMHLILGSLVSMITETTHSGCSAPTDIFRTLFQHHVDPASEQKAWYSYMLFINISS